MPLVDYSCHACTEVTERLILSRDIPDVVACSHCGSQDTVKQVSLFHSRISRKSKYSEDFVEKSMPFLKSQKGIGQLIDEGKGSEESRAHKLSESIGNRVDRIIQAGSPPSE